MDSTILLVTTVGHLVSAVIVGIAGVLVLLQDPKRTFNRTFFLSAIFTMLFGISFAAGINLDPSPLAYRIWMFNLVDILAVATFLHFTFAVLKIDIKKVRWILWGVYAIGGLIIAASFVFPHLFLPEVTSKLFTKSYLNAGPLYYVMVGYFFTVFFLAFVSMLYAYFSGFTKRENRRQLEYFIFATILGYGIAPIDFFLVFDFNVSPLYGMFFGLYMAPIAYGILTDQLVDLRVVLKRALFYSFGIGAITGGLLLLIFLNDFLVRHFAWIQFWTIPLFVALVAVVIGRLFWNKMTENEREKYEFITVATHKLRTPLTQIHWSANELLEKNVDSSVRQFVERIQHANNRLIELTNILFDSTNEDTTQYSYVKERVGLLHITHSVLEKFALEIKKKNLRINVHSDEEIYAFADPRRIEAVIEVFLENAVAYTPEGGLIQVIAYRKGNDAVYSVRDTGIGVLPNERNLIFSRFYRTDAARRIDTEGIGLGLAMAKNIVRKHKGKIGVESQGKDKGSTFWFSIPAT